MLRKRIIEKAKRYAHGGFTPASIADESWFTDWSEPEPAMSRLQGVAPSLSPRTAERFASAIPMPRRAPLPASAAAPRTPWLDLATAEAMNVPYVPERDASRAVPSDPDQPRMVRTSRIDPMTGETVAPASTQWLDYAADHAADIPATEQPGFWTDYTTDAAAMLPASQPAASTAPVIIQGRNGEEFEFPAGMTREAMDAAIQKHYATTQPAASELPTFEIGLPDGRTMRAQAANAEDALQGAQAWWAHQQQQGAPIQVEGPDGNIYEFPAGTSEDVMIDAMARRFPKPTPNDEYGITTAADAMSGPASQGSFPLFAERAANSALMNYGDEVEAAAAALPSVFSGNYQNERGRILTDIRERQRRFAEEDPNAAAVADVTGGIGGAFLVPGAVAGRLLGAAPGVMRSAAVGAGLAGMQGGIDATGRLEGEHTADEYRSAAAEGAWLPALMGGTLGGVAGGIGKFAAPRVSPDVRALLDREVGLTPGEIYGPLAKRLEDASTSIPLSGQAVRNRQAESIASMNRAAWDEALAPMGARISPDTAMGHEAQQEARDIFAQRYGSTLQQMTAVADAPLRREATLQRISLPRAVRERFSDAMTRHVGRYLENNALTGRGMQNAIQGLRKEAQNLRRHPGNAYDFDLADSLDNMRGALERSAERHSPAGAVQRYQDINRAYRNYVPLRDAGSRVGTEASVFSPAQLHSAVRSADQTIGKGAFARGEAPMQDLSGPAKNVMTRRVNDSGTPERAAFMNALGVLGGGAGAVYAPMAAAKAAAAVGAHGLMYSPAVTRALRRLASRDEASKDAIRRAMARAGVMSGVLGDAAFRSGVGGPDGFADGGRVGTFNPLRAVSRLGGGTFGGRAAFADGGGVDG
jgi:hypothetical protein